MNDLSRRRTARSGADLLAAGAIAAEQADLVDRVGEVFAVAVTPGLLDLMKNDADGPIARQFLPSGHELDTADDERTDPIGDATHTKCRGLIHRYPDRVLLTPILVCPVYCRFCFRREAVGDADATLSDADLAAAYDYVRQRPEIFEVILTGGDPLMLPPARLAAIVGALAAIPHVEVIRIHSRVPVTDPRRVTAEMAQALRCSKAVYVVLHANHADELTTDAQDACRTLVDAGIPMLGQTVLLKGVNDTPGVMEALMRRLVANRIKPYYLHHADLARGTAHFRTTLAEGQALMAALRGRLSGIAQPTYVLDIPGGFGKVPVGPSYYDAATATVTDPQGGQHPYPPRKTGGDGG